MHQDSPASNANAPAHERHVEMSALAPQDQAAAATADTTTTTTTTATATATPDTAIPAEGGDDTTTTTTTNTATMASSQDTQVPTSAPAPAPVPAPEPAPAVADTASANDNDDAATATTATATAAAKTAAAMADDDAPAPPSSPKAELTRAETEAIGPASDNPAAKPDTTAGPVVVITLLLTSGARHPYKIDEKYLKKRGVDVENMDPFNISVYTLKELIWRDWREEWEPRPSSPSAIRLISFGRMLDDKQPLRDCRFQAESPNVVHMTVKPQEVVDEEDAKTAKGGSRDHDDNEQTARCRCVIL